MKRSDRVIIKLEFCKKKQPVECKCKNLDTKSKKLSNLKFSNSKEVSNFCEDSLLARVCSMKINVLDTNADDSRVPAR